MIEVYSTNITQKKPAKAVLKVLRKEFPSYVLSLDLNDCDKILRIENPNGNIDEERLKDLITSLGFNILELDDAPMFADVQNSFFNS